VNSEHSRSISSPGSPESNFTGAPDEAMKSPSEKERLFGQLCGESTWKKPDIQLAREMAWENEAVKYKARMERIFKKAKPKLDPLDCIPLTFTTGTKDQVMNVRESTWISRAS